MCRQEFLDCAWDQSVNSCVASHHQEASVSVTVHIQRKDESCRDNLPHHPISAVTWKLLSKHTSGLQYTLV